MKYCLKTIGCTLLFFLTTVLLYAQNQVYSPQQTRTLIEVNTPAAQDSDHVLAITGCRLIDGLGGTPVEDAVVIIKGNRIVDAGPGNEINIPANAEYFDAEGKTVMPGLIDAHFHNLMNNDRINQYLRNGITTMRDPGQPIRFHQSLHFADQPVPRVFLTDSHLDGYPPVWTQQANVVRSAEHARESVYEYVRNGATGVKIYFNLPLEYFETVTDAASLSGVPVMAHLELVDADDAILAGVEGIEHVTSFGTALAETGEAKKFKDALREDYGARRTERFRLWSTIDLESERVKDVIQLAIENDAIMVPTLGVFERYEGDDGVENYHVQGYYNMVKFVGMAYTAGMKISVGSHAGLIHADYGWDFQHEMELLAKAGMDPMDIIVNSTLGNAKYLRTEERLGSIKSRMLADLIIVDGNPVEDIRVMRNVSKVMLNGIWVDSGE
ncbi:MAG: amidohydrolase family protein [Balneolaceae bacterium]|nr:amidohydrolase family protein [Balneolaceae bacterium]